MIQKKYVSLFAFVIGLAGLIGLFLLRSSDHTDNKLAELRSRGIPTTAAEINDFYVIPEGEIDATELWVSALKAMSELKADSITERLPLVGSGSDEIPTPGQPWAQLEEAETFIKSHQNVLDLIHAAAKAGGTARYPVDYSGGNPEMLNYTSDIRLTIQLLELDAWVSLHRGSQSTTFTNIISMFAASKSIMAEPSLTTQLIRQTTFSEACQCMIRLAPWCKWNDEQLQEMQRTIADANVLKELQRALIGDRANFLSTVGDPKLQAMNSTTVAAAIDLYERFVVSMDSGWEEFLKTSDDVATAMQGWTSEERSSKTNSAIAIVFPGIKNAMAVSIETVSRQRASLVALAVLRYETLNARRPTSLDELKPFIDSSFREPWTDPVTQQPLNLRSEGSQTVIYGVGRDRKDDNGHVVPEASAGQANDVGYRF